MGFFKTSFLLQGHLLAIAPIIFNRMCYLVFKNVPRLYPKHHSHCIKYRNFTLFPGDEILLKRSVRRATVESPETLRKLLFHKTSTPGN